MQSDITIFALKFIKQLFCDRKLLCHSFTLCIFETVSLESSNANNSPEFHNILDKPVSSFDGNVITISVFLNCCQATVT